MNNVYNIEHIESFSFFTDHIFIHNVREATM